MKLVIEQNLNKLTSEEVLDLKFSQLKLRIKDSPFEKRIIALFREMESRQLSFKPHIWISDEWFTPDDTPGFAMPFYLFHPKLIKLEQEQMFEAEGARGSECLRILRHETGHAFSHAYQLYKLPSWKKVFGDFSNPYPLWYTPKINSREFVTHLNAWYAQAHPLEDFAETFAVWLDPKSRWQKIYSDWPAYRKLEYVDELIQSIKNRQPILKKAREYASVTRLRSTLREHYRRKKKFYSVEWSAAFDIELLKVFSLKRRLNVRASDFLRKIKKSLRKTMSDLLNIPPYTIDQLLRELIIRSRQLNLYLKFSEEETEKRITILLTAQAVNLIYSGYYRIPL